MSDSLTDIWKLKKRGKRDSDRHKELIKKAIKRNGRDLITEYNIIKSDGNKKIKVPIKFLERYKFKYGKYNDQKGTGQGADVTPGQRYKTQKQKGNGSGEAGDQEGDRVFDAEISIDELVDMLLEEMDLPWMEPTATTEVEMENEEFNSIERKGIMPNLDLKRTIFENLKRHAAMGEPKIGQFHKNDFRYKTWENEKEYHSNAIIYLMMDRSGSMDKEKTDIAKTFYFWMVQFLKKRYKNIDIHFIAHDTEAFICSEDDFFRMSSNGGTKCSSAYKLAYEHIQENYILEENNIYVIEFSDGDNYGEDNDKVLHYVQLLLPLVRAMGYGEIMTDDYRQMPWYSPEKLLSTLLNNSIQRTRFVVMKLSKKEDVFDSLKKFFNVDGVANKGAKK